jgi:hypothetical protein
MLFALQSFRSCRLPEDVTTFGHPLEIGRSFRVSDPCKYRPLGQAIPLCRCAVSLGFAVFPSRVSPVVFKLPALPSRRVQLSFRVLPSIT